MFALPWTRDTVPHAVIELTRECNLACRACYREKSPGFRGVEAVVADVAVVERHQRVHTISLAGGEPTLHPQLVEIVCAVKDRGHRVSLVTNGLLLSEALLGRLAAAGLDIVMIHVDEGQTRPDLPDRANPVAINRLRESIALRVHAHGIAVGLCTTLYPTSLAHLPGLIELFLRHPHINFLFATHAVGIGALVAHVRSGAPAACSSAGTTNGQVIRALRDRFGVEPFACIPPTEPTADGELPCITYTIPVVHGKRMRFLPLRSGAADRFLVRLSRLLAGRYLYFTPDRLVPKLMQIGVNALFSGRFFAATRFFVSGGRGPLRIKRLVFENAPRFTSQGTVNCCDFCPNSTVREGKVVPVCLADHVEALRL